MTEGNAGPHSGKRLNQKLKPYVVLQYLLKNTDENVVSSAQDIVAYLEECGIDAERRSVYRDIKDINLVALMLEEDCSVDEAKEMSMIRIEKASMSVSVIMTRMIFGCWRSAYMLQSL